MPGYEEWKELQKELNAKDGEARRFQQQAQVEVGRRAQMAVDHPGWQTFIEHLTPAIEQLDMKIKHLQTQISDSEEMDVSKFKLQLRDLQGEKRGLETALNLIPSLVQRGEEAKAAIG